MERPISVFISSILNKKLEDLSNERREIKNAIKDLVLTKPWCFEETPASYKKVEQYYLEAVKNCDIFILLLGSSISKAVKSEYTTAVKSKKPILVFLKSVERTRELQDFLTKDIHVKWKEFLTYRDLYYQVQVSLAETLRDMIDKNIFLLTREDKRVLHSGQKQANRAIRAIHTAIKLPASRITVDTSPLEITYAEGLGPIVFYEGSNTICVNPYSQREAREWYFTGEAPIKYYTEGKLYKGTDSKVYIIALGTTGTFFYVLGRKSGRLIFRKAFRDRNILLKYKAKYRREIKETPDSMPEIIICNEFYY